MKSAINSINQNEQKYFCKTCPEVTFAWVFESRRTSELENRLLWKEGAYRRASQWDPWFLMLETKSVGGKFEMLVTIVWFNQKPRVTLWCVKPIIITKWPSNFNYGPPFSWGRINLLPISKLKKIKCLKERHHVLRNRSNVRSNVESRTSDEDDCGYSTESDNTFDKTETLV